MCEKLVGLGDVDLVGINDTGEGTPLRVVIRSRKPRPACEGCGGLVWSKGYRTAVSVDLPAFGRPVRLRWRKRRWTCPNPDCAQKSFVEQDPTISPPRALLTTRAARWATIQVGRRGRPVEEVAEELGCDWHTVNREVARWGEALLEADTDRYGAVEAVGVMATSTPPSGVVSTEFRTSEFPDSPAAATSIARSRSTARVNLGPKPATSSALTSNGPSITTEHPRQEWGTPQMRSLTLHERTYVRILTSQPVRWLWGTGALAAVLAAEKRRQSPAEEETDSWDPYHYPWSGVVAKTPHRGLRVLGCVEFAG